jgi:hypothetical protein
MALPRRTTEREDLLPLDRAFRSLEDAHKSFKEFPKKEAVARNAPVKDAVASARKKIKATEGDLEWDERFQADFLKKGVRIR